MIITLAKISLWIGIQCCLRYITVCCLLFFFMYYFYLHCTSILAEVWSTPSEILSSLIISTMSGNRMFKIWEYWETILTRFPSKFCQSESLTLEHSTQYYLFIYLSFYLLNHSDGFSCFGSLWVHIFPSKSQPISDFRYSNSS